MTHAEVTLKPQRAVVCRNRDVSGADLRKAIEDQRFLVVSIA